MAIKETKVPTDELAIGMYISKLDRPWIETPFPLQGFLIRSESDLDMLEKYCNFVIIDEQLGRPADSFDPKARQKAKASASADEAEKPKQVPRKQKFVRVKYEPPIAVEKEIKKVRAYHKQVNSAIAQVYDSLAGNHKLNLRVVRQASSVIVNSVIRNPDALLWLTRMKTNRTSAYERAMRLGVLGAIAGRHIGVPQDALENMSTALLMSEIGSQVDVRILRDAEPLEGRDKAEVQNHINSALEKLKSSNVPEDVLTTIRYHHERFNGTGLLTGLEGSEIPLTARIAGLVDVYDACITGDENTPGLAASQAVSQLNKYRDVLFQSDLIEHFIQAMGVYPTGTSVELKNGFRAAVIGQNPERRLRPKLLIIQNADGERIEKGQIVDLLSESNSAYAIERTISENLMAG